jgi:hypothetical protein
VHFTADAIFLTPSIIAALACSPYKVCLRIEN